MGRLLLNTAKNIGMETKARMRMRYERDMSSIQYEGIRTFLPPEIFSDLEELGPYELYQVFMCQTVLIFPNI